MKEIEGRHWKGLMKGKFFYKLSLKRDKINGNGQHSEKQFCVIHINTKNWHKASLSRLFFFFQSKCKLYLLHFNGRENRTVVFINNRK